MEDYRAWEIWCENERLNGRDPFGPENCIGSLDECPYNTNPNTNSKENLTNAIINFNKGFNDAILNTLMRQLGDEKHD